MLKTRTVIRQERMRPVAFWSLIFVAVILAMAIGFVAGVKLTLPSGSTPIAEMGYQAPSAIRDIQKVASLPGSRWKFKSLAKERKCLADNIYFEARNQNLRGRLAVGLVTLNRVKSKHYPNSICEVVWQKATDKNSGKQVAQFSWTLDGESDKAHNAEAYELAMQAAGALIGGANLNNLADFTKGATHYHANYVTPYWADSMERLVKVGTHVFYKQG